MASEPIRDPIKDHLNSIVSMERQRLVTNIIRAAKAAVLYGLPVAAAEE